MIPVYISGCFGVLHPAEGKQGVLICSTLGDEALNVYRPLVFLAEQFAAAGSPALRLQYYGTGDSGGEDDEPGRFQAWLASISAAARWLRETCGVGPVTLVGIRIGAALVARAACEIDDVESLVLLSPVPNGRRFLREQILRARTIAEIWQLESRIDNGEWFEAHGLRLDQPTREALDRLDVGQLPCCPAPRALVLDQRGSPAGGILAERLRRLGTDVTCAAAESLQQMLRDPYENAVPHDAFARAVGWHADSCCRPAGAVGLGTQPADPCALTAIRPRHAEEAATWLATGHGIEVPIQFGSNDRLFGILSTPAHPRDNAPPVLIANTGANPRYANSRVAVLVARWLAANGIASLRMDGAGIGDSAIDTGERGQPYARQGDWDLTAAIDELSRRFATPVLVLGMCSGAFHALRAAFEDRRIAGLMLVNLQKFVWREGDSLSVVQRITPRTTGFYVRNLFRQHALQRLFHGKVSIGGIAGALAKRLLHKIIAAGDPALALLQRHETRVGRVRRQVRDLQQRNVPMLFVLSGNDPGLVEIGEYFGGQGRQFRRQSNVMFRLLEGADHTLSGHSAREMLLGLIATFLRQRCSLIIDPADPATPAAAQITPPRLSKAIVTPIAVKPGVIDTRGSAA